MGVTNTKPAIETSEFEQALEFGPIEAPFCSKLNAEERRIVYYNILSKAMSDTSMVTYEHLNSDFETLELRDDSNAKLMLGLVHYFGLQFRDVDQKRGRELITAAAKDRNPLAIATLARIRRASFCTTNCSFRNEGCYCVEEPRFSFEVSRVLFELRDHPIATIVNALERVELGNAWKSNRNAQISDEKKRTIHQKFGVLSQKCTQQATQNYPELKSLHLFLSGHLKKSMRLGCTAAVIRLARYNDIGTPGFIHAVRYIAFLKRKCTSEMDEKGEIPLVNYWNLHVVFYPHAYEALMCDEAAHAWLEKSMEPREWNDVLLFNTAYQRVKNEVQLKLPQPITEEIVHNLVYYASNANRKINVKRQRVVQ